MKFKVVESPIDCKERGTFYLILDSWDDWFKYSTQYNAYYYSKKGKLISLSRVKIGQKNQERTPELPSEFDQLSDEYFSLGSSEFYYERIKQLSPKGSLRVKIFEALNDVAYDLNKFKNALSYDVTNTSLLRDKTETMVKNQFHRMANGGERLTDYDFTYETSSNDLVESVKLDFEVVPEEIPPSNIHVLIGKNGVGKTTILKNMLFSITKEDKDIYGEMDYLCGSKFSNVVFVSFSIFDDMIELDDTLIPFLNIGANNNYHDNDSHQNMGESFAESLFEVSKGHKKKLWENAIKVLESDNTFEELDIINWSKHISNGNSLEGINKLEDESDFEYSKRKAKLIFFENIIPKFKKLSSGHKVILLTVVKLIECVEEKTLVLLDEPEEHLHPPLVAAFIRTLSDLLVYRNGVGVIATHSPVIVQEVQKKCVWILRRIDNTMVAERPPIETFGENLGILTSEIFGYEVTNSGFHKMITIAAKKRKTYKRSLRYFNENLGNEGRAILRSLTYKNEETNADD